MNTGDITGECFGGPHDGEVITITGSRPVMDLPVVMRVRSDLFARYVWDGGRGGWVFVGTWGYPAEQAA